MCKVGFTGTRNGMNNAQKKALQELISQKEIYEFRHGDCVGSDAQAHSIATEIKKIKNIKIIGHPPKYNKFRAFCNFDLELKPVDYISRNMNIVDETDFLIATPVPSERLHSGTWSTIRYARSKNKRIYIIHKSGRVTIDK